MSVREIYRLYDKTERSSKMCFGLQSYRLMEYDSPDTGLAYLERMIKQALDTHRSDVNGGNG